MAERIPLSVYRLTTGRAVLALYYHVVSDECLPHIRHRYSYKTQRMFENDLLYLVRNYNLITYEQLAAHYSTGQELEPKSMVLTFDDGLAECYSVVRPLLLKHGVPCVFFVTTRYVDNRDMGYNLKASLCIDRIRSCEGNDISRLFRCTGAASGTSLSTAQGLESWVESAAGCEDPAIDNLCRMLGIDVKEYLATGRPYLTSDEIRHLDSDGFTIGAHSVNHRQLGGQAEPEVERAIVDSCRTIVSLSGKPHVPFAFPSSADGVSRSLLRAIRDRHRHVGLFFGTGGVLHENGIVINRVCGDWPQGANEFSSNLPRRLARAYLENLALRIRSS